MKRTISSLTLACLSQVLLAQELLYDRDFRVTVVPRVSGFTSIESPACNRYGESASTNIQVITGDMAAAFWAAPAASATEYVPLIGGTKCGAVCLNDGTGIAGSARPCRHKITKRGGSYRSTTPTHV